MDIKKLIESAVAPPEETSRAKTAASDKARGTEGPRIPPSGEGSADRVSLRTKSMTQDAAAELAASEAAARSAETISRADKVKMLKEAVQRGVYKPDIQDVARNLLFSDFKPLA